MKKISLLLLIILSACTAQQNKVSVLDKSSCNLPCWSNITVGQTTQDEFFEFLEMSTDIDQDAIIFDNQPWNIFDNSVFFSFDDGSFLNPKPSVRMNASFSNNIVNDLQIFGELNTTIGDINEQIGEPTNIISGGNIKGNRDVIFINSTLGVSYWYETDPAFGELEYELNPEIEVKCLDIFNPSLYEELMEVGLFSMGHYNAEETRRVMYSWDGYGNLNEKYPPRQP